MSAEYTPNLLNFLFSSHFGQELSKYFHYLLLNQQSIGPPRRGRSHFFRSSCAGGPCVGVPKTGERTMTGSNSYEDEEQSRHEQARWQGWAIVLLVIAACILLLRFLG